MASENKSKVGVKDASYPRLLKEIKNPPENLFIKGSIECLNKPAVAIVGTRKATQLGRKIAEDIAYTLGKRGFVIVSGLAMGIDTAAHTGALKAGAKTVAVLGNGVNRIYPAQNENLAKKILEAKGAIISEYGPKAPGHKGIFLDRNRIISGLSIATVVVEAPFKSGSINTASWAGDQGRSLFVIPGPVNHQNYMGSHKLIRDGAILATSAEDILEDLGVITGINEEAETNLIFENDIQKSIFEAIQESGSAVSADEIIDITGLDAEIVNINLANLIIQKIIKEAPNGYTLA